jgi:hypothetical protein
MLFPDERAQGTRSDPDLNANMQARFVSMTSAMSTFAPYKPVTAGSTFLPHWSS